MKLLKTFLIAAAAVSVIFAFTTYGSEAPDCLKCHKDSDPGIVGQWKDSKHFKAGVGCYNCHKAESDDKDAFKHMGVNIATIVSPKDCSSCHKKEYEQQKGSHHAKAAQILGSLDNLLGEVVGGQPAVNAGCRQCHGSKVKIDDQGQPTSDTWPNTGMGRINPDGSKGSCAACHTRHEFSVRQARQPEACGKCHLGPDHPQIEVWKESKHGILYRANREKLNLDSEKWRPGKEYFTGPTCSSCHMGEAGEEELTHDVGKRISWTLRPPISKKLNQVIYEDGSQEDITGEDAELPSEGDSYKQKTVKKVLSWRERRNKMQTVCTQCHQKSFVEGAYKQFDEVVHLYNDKFAKPARTIIQELKDRGKISKEDFDDPIEWTWWELWHHEGRRARHGAAMQGPDYAWWHGLYEVSKHFYEKFIPQLKKTAGKELAEKLLEEHVYSQPGHKWHKEGMSKEALEKIQKFYEERYDQ